MKPFHFLLGTMEIYPFGKKELQGSHFGVQINTYLLFQNYAVKRVEQA